MGVLALTDEATGPSTAGLVIAAAALPVVLAPTAVRLLAHPRSAALPPQAHRTAVAGITGALSCLVAGLVALTASGEADDSRALAVLTALTALVTVGAGVVAAPLCRTRPGPRASHRPGPATCPRPDLFDDLALLSARAVPGSPAARGLARLNRGLDRWTWSPRRRTSRPLGRPVRLARSAVPVTQPE
jgi:hypothetical protein